MDINIRTIAFIIGLTHIIQFIVIYYQYKINKNYKGIGWWLIWSSTEVLGFFVIVLRSFIPANAILIIAQNSFIISGTIFLYAGIMSFFGKRVNWKLAISIFTIFILLLCYFMIINDNIVIRGIIIDVTLVTMSFFTAYNLYKNKIKSVASSANFITVILILHGIVFIYMALMFTFTADGYEMYASNFSNILQFTDAFMSGLFWTFGFIIMINQRLNSENIEEKDQLEMIFNTSPDAVLITQLTDGCFVRINDGFTLLTGYTREDVIGKSSLEIKIWNDPKERGKFVSKLNVDGIVENLEFEFIRKDRNKFLGMVSAKIIYLSGNPYILSVTRDVSEPRRIELKLLESEDRLNRAEKVAKIGNWKLILENKEIISSVGARIIYGLENGNMSLEDVQRIPLPEYREMLDKALKDLIEKNTPYNLEFKIRKPNDGKIIDVHSLAEYDRENNIVYGVVYDVTEQREADEALRISEQKLKRIFNSAMIGIGITDINGNYYLYNEWMLNIFGYSKEEMDKLTNLDITHPDDREDSKIWFLKLINGEVDNYYLEKRFIRKDGSTFWSNLYASAVKDRNNNIINIIGVFTDITERKQAVDEIKQKNEELQKLNSEKDKFFSIIAHDLRSPFNGFLGLTELMVTDLHKMSQDDINQIADKLHRSANNLYRLLTNLLEWSKMQRGMTEFNPEHFPLKSLTDESIKIFYDSAEKKGVEIEEEIPEDILVSADKAMLETIIRNLVSNALKFTNKGGKVRIYAKSVNDSIEISVKDTGIGMCKDLVDNLFNIDKQTSRKGTDDEPSTGLGLLLCKEFIKKHNGKITVLSEEGKGSEFRVTLVGG